MLSQGKKSANTQQHKPVTAVVVDFCYYYDFFFLIQLNSQAFPFHLKSNTTWRRDHVTSAFISNGVEINSGAVSRRRHQAQ